ncbi:Phosphopantetheinyl transferase [Colletotrichum higginsianum IMI 349063]|uniref:holo-[acyl-carrier-protein] synthase n=3 Tax=Colletotrichum higginsianum TaxID=80884 RepID=A0A1B7Y9K5_COLHI|nr:Phosphopantetheinyl transferase [Colletotrichum higginsianum IMI 349063]OBR08670.1 Phosphopantetheinyl transferase [Colletotrichum higginsianum IMI 349063]TIC95950.1 L-aminoadipate-semialdehyde dehydrogenase-phosphopantetheinyl transferase [Colletotrichum higginsianum]
MAPTIIQWILDTRHLWPEATETKQLEQVASRALELLKPEERKAVLKYYHVRDAKLSLGSHLLKRYAISRFCGIPWPEATAVRDERTKPIFRAADGTTPLSFNVSHQAGLVALFAVHGYDATNGPVDVGVDVVCTSERRSRDHAMLRNEGWPKFVDIHADVLSPLEANFLKWQVLADIPPGLKPGASIEDAADFKLRCFYALWCLREAYVKMTGDALLAPWLAELQFKKFRPPAPAESFEADGEAVTEHDIVFKGTKIEDVKVSLRALGPDYMTCSAVRTPQRKEDGLAFELGPYKMLDIDEVLAFGESHLSC